MKKEFFEKWQSDKRYRAKVKLLLYGIFIIIVTIYAITLNNTTINTNIVNEIDDNETELTTTTGIINIPDKYNYRITITIDDKQIEYSGINLPDKTTITKVIDDTSTNYIYQNNEYYILDNDIYIKTTKKEVYDIVNYNYINLDNINNYIEKSKKENNQYVVYLKDIILGNNSDDYFIILVNNNEVSVDYTPLVKEFNNNIDKYKVHIKIEEYKEVSQNEERIK